MQQRQLATWMALWLLAISLVAPTHELEHIDVGHVGHAGHIRAVGKFEYLEHLEHPGHDEPAHDASCTFFVHCQQLITALAFAELPSMAPSRALTATPTPLHGPSRVHCGHCTIRAPPLSS